MRTAVLIGGPLDGREIGVPEPPAKAILTYCRDDGHDHDRDPHDRCRIVPQVWYLVRSDVDGMPSIDDHGRYRYHL